MKSIIDNIVATLKPVAAKYPKPLVDQIIEDFGHNPYLILISCLLSLRVKDSTTIHVCRKLFSKAKTPQQLCALKRTELELLIFKTGFYRTKARVIQDVSQALLDRFDGDVPQTYEELMSIKGVGPKTANLVMGLAFNKPAICVDTHVHRISNRLGLIKTKTVEETNKELEKVLPKKYWTIWNHLFVIWGQNVCVPLSPQCSKCVINKQCKKVGVVRSR